MNTYNTKGTCSRQILFDVTEDRKIKNVKFIGGCSGNLQAVARLVDGKDIDYVIEPLSGMIVFGKNGWVADYRRRKVVQLDGKQLEQLKMLSSIASPDSTKVVIARSRKNTSNVFFHFRALYKIARIPKFILLAPP